MFDDFHGVRADGVRQILTVTVKNSEVDFNNVTNIAATAKGGTADVTIEGYRLCVQQYFRRRCPGA